MRAPAAPDDIARLPILVGFSGRRRFSDDAEENQRLIGIAAERFRRIVRWLDRELPLTPKVLICGGDAGADLAVTSVVLAGAPQQPEHPIWSVVLMHAFAGYAPDAATVAAYDALKRANPQRIVTRSLPPLLKLPVDENDPDQALTMAEQAPGPAASSEARDHFRSGHFEQHALWLARYATLQIAASAAGSAEHGVAKAGATARLVAYRRADVADRFAASVIERSQALLAGSPLDEPDGGHVLWIDPTAADRWPAELPPATVLGPMQEHYDQRQPAQSLDQARDAFYREPFREVPEGGRPIVENPGSALEHALEVGRKFEDLHRRFLPWWRRLRWDRRSAPVAAVFSDEAPHRFLKRLRAGTAPIGREQLRTHAVVRWSLRGLIIAFLGAVFCFEGYLELQPQVNWWLFGYVLVLTGIGIVVFALTKVNAARRAEDLRGLREILRVQIAWWASGIDRMVDRVHLRSIDSDLKIIREIAATISMWGLLRTSAEIPIRSCEFGEASAWIDEQVNYHRGRWLSNDGFKQLSQQGASIGLGTAWLSLLVLFVINTWFGAGFDLAAISRTWTAAALAAWIVLAFLVAAEFTRQFTGGRLRLRRPRGFWETATAAGTLMAALALAAMPLGAGDLVDSRWRPRMSVLLALLFVLALALAWSVRMEWRTKAWTVAKMSSWQQLRCIVTTTGFLLGFAGILAAVPAWIGSQPNFPSKDASGVIDQAQEVQYAFRAWVLATTTLLLAASGMLRYYVERRNHAAQAAQSDDCHRAFLRARSTLASARQALADSQNRDEQALRDARKLIVQIGELALDENEAWLRAHRERPLEAIR